jgi:hypothetical protein
VRNTLESRINTSLSRQDPQKQTTSEHLRLETFSITGAGERNRTLDLLITSYEKIPFLDVDLD